jgi:predicted nucleotidyltransferase
MKEHDLKRLFNYLSKYPVIIGYVFGSEAKGESGPLSDMDIAVFVDKSIDKSGRFDLKLRLSNELSSIMDRRVDLVILNDTPVQLSFEVIKDGELVFCRDQSIKVAVETEILSKYLDRRYYDKRHAELALEKIASRGLQST